MKTLIKSIPNDKELGAAVRKAQGVLDNLKNLPLQVDRENLIVTFGENQKAPRDLRGLLLENFKEIEENKQILYQYVW